MSFTAGQSFSFGEQPSTTKWNYLWGNDYALQDWSAFTNDTFPVALMDSDMSDFGFMELDRTTLGSGGDTITVSSFAAKAMLKIVVKALDTGGTLTGQMTFNSDSGSNYSGRRSIDGAADSSSTSQAYIQLAGATVASPFLAEAMIYNVAADEKCVLSRTVHANTAGAGTAPTKVEAAWKWVNTSNQITTVSVVNAGSGDFATGSEVIVYGKD